MTVSIWSGYNKPRPANDPKSDSTPETVMPRGPDFRNVFTLALLILLCAAWPARADDRPEKKVDRYGDPLPPGAVARLGTTRFRQSIDAAFSPDGKLLATFCRGKIRIWDVETGKQARQIETNGTCHALAFSPDGKRLAQSRDAGARVDFWDLATGRPVLGFLSKEATRSSVTRIGALVYSADGKTIHTTDDIAGHAWNLATSEQSSFPHPSGGRGGRADTCVFSADGRFLATVAASSKKVLVWSVADGKLHQEFDVGDKHGVGCAAFSPKGDLLATGGSGKVVDVWDVTTGKKQCALRKSGDTVVSIAFNHDGSCLAVAVDGGIESTPTGSHKVQLWNVAAEEVVLTLSTPGVRRVQFSPDGKLLAWEAHGATVCLVDVKTGKDLHPFEAHKGPVVTLSYSADGKLLATGSEDGDIRLWEAATGAPVRTLTGHKDHVTAVAFSPNGQLLVSGCRDDTTAVWDVATGKQKWEQRGHPVNSVAFAPDGKTVVAGGNDPKLNVWDAESGKLLQTLGDGKAIVLGPVYLPDGKTLVTVGEASLRFWDVKGEKVAREIATANLGVRAMALSPDGKFIAVSGGSEGSVWDVGSGKVVLTCKHGGPVAFSPDGKYFGLASSGAWGGGSKSLFAWDTKTWKEVSLADIPLPLFQGFYALAFSPDGKQVATADSSAEVILWDLKK